MVDAVVPLVCKEILAQVPGRNLITARSPRAVARPKLPQILTCPIRATGSSDYGFASRR